MGNKAIIEARRKANSEEYNKDFLKGLYKLYSVYKKADWRNGMTFDNWLIANKYL